MRSRLPSHIFGMGFVDSELLLASAANRERLGLEPPSSSGFLPSPRSGLGAISGIESLASLSGVIRSATLRTNFTPPVTWRPGESEPTSADGSPPSTILKTLQPALDLELATGHVETIAPAGEPTGDYRVGLAIGATLVGATLAGTFLAGVAYGRRRAKSGARRRR